MLRRIVLLALLCPIPIGCSLLFPSPSATTSDGVGDGDGDGDGGGDGDGDGDNAGDGDGDGDGSLDGGVIGDGDGDGDGGDGDGDGDNAGDGGPPDGGLREPDAGPADGGRSLDGGANGDGDGDGDGDISDGGTIPGLDAGVIAQPPCGAYANAIEVTFDGEASPPMEPLVDFPALVDLSNVSNLPSTMPKLAVHDETGHPLAFEVDRWSSGDRALWVKTQLAPGSISRVFVCVTVDEGPTDPPMVDPATWSNGFTSVMHLDSLSDSTGINADAVETDTDINTSDAKIGRAREFDDRDDRIAFTVDNMNATSGTISVWARPRFESIYSWVFTVADDSSQTGEGAGEINIQAEDDDVWELHHGRDAAPRVINSNIDVDEDDWVHLALTWDADNSVTFYIDGQPTGSSNLGVSMSTFGVWVLGDIATDDDDTFDERCFYGELDEFRAANVARSAEWMRVSHASMDGRLTTIGTLQAVVAPPPP